MDRRFQAAYKQLNDQQRKAVDAIDGPVMVVAGPGTGKTQLLSTRVANIIRQTDTVPANILCLTFTDNAARNMRERLETIIGQAAYHVAIHTFHSFGAEIINQFPDYFTERQLLQQIDELGRYELLRQIFEELPHSNPLSAKVGDDYIFLSDTLEVISWLKQNALGPPELHAIIAANQKFMDQIAIIVAETFATPTSPKQLKNYQKLLNRVQGLATGQLYFGFPEYAAMCATELEAAIAKTPADGRYAPAITVWRNAWCQKDAQGRHVFKDAGRSFRKMHALANIYQKLLDEMAEQGLFDFDDMIIEVVRTLESSDELRFSLQEHYQYVLVDEFQDTNKAQLRMLTSLGANPIFEGRPNIMAVGDDDQAIYAFQGAEVSNMVAFTRQYRQPTLITLQDNYRSDVNILDAGFTVAEQITDRLGTILPNTHKQLSAQAKYPQATLQHPVFPSELAQYDWVARRIQELISKEKLKPEEIAVIAPQHRYLERLMPYLGQHQIPVAYERRENILEAPIIIQLLTMAELLLAIANNRQDDVDALISRVLGYDFWDIEPEILLQISLDSYNKHIHWLPILIKHKNKKVKTIAAWLNHLAKYSTTEPLEYMLDQLLGTVVEDVESADDPMQPLPPASHYVSPLRTFYFSQRHYEKGTDNYLTLLGQLATLRQRLRQWRPNRTLYLHDLVNFVALHQTANLKIIDTNPHTQTTNAVQVMTAYKAKGLEFAAVFVINAQDEVWGPTARHYSPRITLPKNLPLAPASDGDNDRLRLLFVALTRAKYHLYVTGYSHSLENKLSAGLSFIGGDSQAVHHGFRPQLVDKPAPPRAQEILSTDWAYRFRQVIADKPTLFEPILERYQLSITHLNNFLDVRAGGPRYFLTHNLLRFPEAPIPTAAYGDVMHRLLQLAHQELRAKTKLPTIKQLQKYFIELLAKKHLRKSDRVRLEKRGLETIELYFRQQGKRFSAQDIVERGFNNDGVVVNDARLSGKIDQLHFLEAGVVQVVDFKTGKPAITWQSTDDYERVKLHKYRQQLLFYKLLVEQSASFRGRLAVANGAVAFLEADEHGKLVDNLELAFETKEVQRFIQLIGVVWQHIMQLNFPDVSHYPKSARGIAQFEEDLLDGKI